jgi:hypothetical protein
VPPRRPLVLPPNFRDVTAEKVGTVVAIVGAPAAPYQAVSLVGLLLGI